MGTKKNRTAVRTGKRHLWLVGGSCGRERCREEKGAQRSMMVMARTGENRSGRGGGAKPPKGQRPEPEKLDIHEQVTARILEKLEAGTVAWQSSSIARVGLPRNFSTGKVYRGINVFLLSLQEFESPYFLTYLQAKELGGHVKQGERGFPVVKMGVWEKERGDGSTTADGDPATEKRRFLKLYTVFNASQIEGIEFPAAEKCETYTPSQQAAAAQLLVDNMPNPPAIYRGRKACPHYVPSTDTVEMPSKESFRAEWRYFKTLFHEIGHSTGHLTRLNRRSLVENQGMFTVSAEGRKTYCEEELVAEMTAAFLGAHAGIIEDDFDNSAAYLRGWMEALKISEHKTWLIRAASEAQKAVDYVLGVEAK